MKKLRISVNNKVYDVVVQVLEDDEQQVPGANALYPLSTVLPAAPMSSQPAPTTVPSPATPRGGGVSLDAILAPIAGTVQKVFIEAGKTIEAKAPAVLLDAMKMDTYIYAPRSGEVAEVLVAAGSSVAVGDVLMRYKPE